MATYTVTCEWCKRVSVKQGNLKKRIRFCNTSCSAKWRMSRPDYVASLDTPKRKEAARVNLQRLWKENPGGTTAQRAYLTSERNPFKDPTVQAKARAGTAATGYAHLTGGNGKGATKPQALLATRLGWPTEIVVPTGRKSPWPSSYKVDIAEPRLMVAIEVDGAGHNSPTARAKDAKKTELLTDLGWAVLRYANRRILKDIESVLTEIQAVVSYTTSRRKHTTT